MAGTFEVNGTTTTVIFQYTALTAKISNIVNDAAHALWKSGLGDHGTIENPNLFDDLTNQEKLDIVDDGVKNFILDVANSYKIQEAMEAAKQDELSTKYTL